MVRGNQQARVIARVKAGHGEYADAPASALIGGLTVSPVGSSERLATTETTVSRWKFQGPPDFPLDSANVIDVVGIGRLHAEGDLQVAFDAMGRPDHVTGLLIRWKG